VVLVAWSLGRHSAIDLTYPGGAEALASSCRNWTGAVDLTKTIGYTHQVRGKETAVPIAEITPTVHLLEVDGQLWGCHVVGGRLGIADVVK
jgi:hypothetical protein